MGTFVIQQSLLSWPPAKQWRSILWYCKVVVRVWNKLTTEAISVHWHGLYQRGNYFMDGASYITQCPTGPLQKFTYRFIAEPAGTHWYHSHQGTQHIDGLYGSFNNN